MRTYLLLVLLGVVVLAPQAAHAAVSFNVFVSMLIGGFNSVVVPLIFAFASLFFLFGVFKYFIWGGDSDKSREEGRMFILWSVVALAVMVSAWGLVRVFINTFGL